MSLSERRARLRRAGRAQALLDSFPDVRESSFAENELTPPARVHPLMRVQIRTEDEARARVPRRAGWLRGGPDEPGGPARG